MTTLNQDAETVRTLLQKHFAPLEGDPEGDARRLYPEMPPGRMNETIATAFADARGLPNNPRYRRAFGRAAILLRMAEFSRMTVDEKRAWVAEYGVRRT